MSVIFLNTLYIPTGRYEYDSDQKGELTMERPRRITGAILFATLLVTVLLSALSKARAQEPSSAYPKMVPIDQYLMADRDTEIAMARSAAPPSISADAEVMVLGRRGYETAVKGKNGFACLVERSWMSPFDFSQFWNPKMRGPICFNPAAVRSIMPLTFKRTELVLAGLSKAQMVDNINTAFAKKELPTLEPGSMCYMLSRQGHLSDQDGHWHPHLMFFVPQTDDKTWGANLPGSPILALKDTQDRLTVFLIPVAKWSDGTAAPMDDH